MIASVARPYLAGVAALGLGLAGLVAVLGAAGHAAGPAVVVSQACLGDAEDAVRLARQLGRWQTADPTDRLMLTWMLAARCGRPPDAEIEAAAARAIERLRSSQPAP